MIGCREPNPKRSSTVRFVTGHSKSGELPDDMDWCGLADGKTSLVFYMGGRTAPAIAERLMSHGLEATTPVVVTAGVSRPTEAHWTGSLAALAGGQAKNNCGQPVLIAIGKTFATATVHRQNRTADVSPAIAKMAS